MSAAIILVAPCDAWIAAVPWFARSGRVRGAVRLGAILPTLAALALLASACGSSSESETFTGPSPVRCSPTLAAESTAFPAAGGSGDLRISVSRDCQWTARAEAAWITLASGEGQGDGSVRFTVASNAGAASRNTSIVVNEQRVAIAQQGRPCEFTVSSNREAVEASGGERTIRVRATSADCAWTAEANDAWITIVSAQQGRGDGEVRFRVAALSGPPRTGTLTVAGQRVLVEQGTGCTYSIGAETVHMAPSGGDREIAVTAAPGCAWTSESHTPWITVVNGSTGSGSGAVLLRVAGTNEPERTGTVTIAGRIVTVVQGSGCSVSVSPATVNAPAAGATSPIQVETAASCSWSAASEVPWITISGPANGHGRAQVPLVVAANVGPARSGAVVISGQRIVVSQASGCTVSVTPNSVNAPAGATSSPIQVETAAGCPWTAATDVPWITISGPTSGSGRAQVALAIAANVGPARSGAVGVSGHRIAVAQASGCQYSVSPPAQQISGSGGPAAASVATTPGCTWTASGNVSWITMGATSGNGPGQATFTVAPNLTPARSATLTIAGQSHTVNQASQCTWTFVPGVHEMPAGGGFGAVLVILSGGQCSWTSTSTVDWIRLVFGESGTGDGSVQFIVSPNNGPARTGVILIAGEKYMIPQQGTR